MPKTLGVKSAKELSGATVCVQTGTTTELNLADFFRANKLPFKPVTIEKYEEVTQAFLAGRCDALTSDKSQLASIRANDTPNPDDYVILPEMISKEPLTPSVRQGDDQWFDIVQWVAVRDDRGGGAGHHLAANVDEALKSDDPNVQRLLGVTPGMGTALGLDEKWAYNIIKQVGNYGESFERNVGQGSKLKLRARAQRPVEPRRADVRAADPLGQTAACRLLCRRRRSRRPLIAPGAGSSHGSFQRIARDPRPPARPAAVRRLVERPAGAGGPLPAPGARRRRPARRLPRRQHARQPGTAQHRHRLRLPRPRGRLRRQRKPDRLQPRRHLLPRPARRPAQHPAGLRSRRRAGHHPRHRRRRRPAVAQLAGGAARHPLRRDAAQHPGAAAALLLVHPDHRGAAEPAPGAEPAAGRVLEQPRHARAGAGRGPGLPLRRRRPGRSGSSAPGCSSRWAQAPPGPDRADPAPRLDRRRR